MDQLQTLTWQYVAGRVDPADLPMAAAHLLVEGFDSPALRDLAGRARGDGTREVFREALAELGTALPDERTAERCLIHHLAGRLVAGELTPATVAGEVWLLAMEGGTGAEAEFLDAIGPEYLIDLLTDGPSERYLAWEDSVRSAAARLCRAEAPLR
ncbi:hypothetical protein ABTY61_16580 [Kitasatospora sp. NPDC096128]|uniref:hypothetical protein n=1 Tax=Kitasatospora sp. NPDC096128 TaxID=3155547 RepID=UPI0033240C27